MTEHPRKWCEWWGRLAWWRGAPRIGGCVLGAMVLVAGGVVRVVAADAGTTVRLGIAQGMWAGINPNDAMAAIRAWTETILKQRDDSARVDSRLFDDLERLSQALDQGSVDGATLQASRFLALDPKVRPAEVFVSAKQGSWTERYVLVTHAASGFADAAAVRGQSIALHQGPRTCLAQPWLELVLADPATGLVEEAVRGVKEVDSPSRAVLAVFFRQVAAGLVTSNALDLACELNPQLRRDLRVLAVSPPVVPSLFFFRTTYAAPERGRLEAAISELHGTPQGQQVLAVFQCDRMERLPVSCLDSTQALLAAWADLRRRAGPPADGAASGLEAVLGVPAAPGGAPLTSGGSR